MREHKVEFYREDLMILLEYFKQHYIALSMQGGTPDLLHLFESRECEKYFSSLQGKIIKMGIKKKPKTKLKLTQLSVDFMYKVLQADYPDLPTPHEIIMKLGSITTTLHVAEKA